MPGAVSESIIVSRSAHSVTRGSQENTIFEHILTTYITNDFTSNEIFSHLLRQLLTEKRSKSVKRLVFDYTCQGYSFYPGPQRDKFFE